jgi:hypothetical protein
MHAQKLKFRIVTWWLRLGKGGHALPYLSHLLTTIQEGCRIHDLHTSKSGYNRVTCKVTHKRSPL